MKLGYKCVYLTVFHERSNLHIPCVTGIPPKCGCEERDKLHGIKPDERPMHYGSGIRSREVWRMHGDTSGAKMPSHESPEGY